MSKIKKLINELCPNGVEYKELFECIDYVQPQKYIVNNTDYSNEYKIPVMTAGKSFILGYTNEINGIYNATENNPVIIFDDFTTSKHWINFNFKVKSSALKILIPKIECVNFRYIFYMMEAIKFDKGEHGRQWISKYSKIKIPVPPIEVQKEIVNILDNFTELTAELTAELTGRKKQYEYYRNKMLIFSDGVEEKKLKDILTIQGGYTPAKNNPDFWNGGDIPWLRMEDIRKNGRILETAIQSITKTGARKIFSANSIILSTTATIGEHALIEREFVANQQFTIFTLKDEQSDLINIKYLFYYFYIIGKLCKDNQSMSSFPSVKMPWLKNLKITIPPIDVQNEIVKKLDKFDSLINDISEGLPAEIEMRQKQYEYYRNKLLTFKEL